MAVRDRVLAASVLISALAGLLELAYLFMMRSVMRSVQRTPFFASLASLSVLPLWMLASFVGTVYPDGLNMLTIRPMAPLSNGGDKGTEKEMKLVREETLFLAATGVISRSLMFAALSQAKVSVVAVFHFASGAFVWHLAQLRYGAQRVQLPKPISMGIMLFHMSVLIWLFEVPSGDSGFSLENDFTMKVILLLYCVTNAVDTFGRAVTASRANKLADSDDGMIVASSTKLRTAPTEATWMLVAAIIWDCILAPNVSGTTQATPAGSVDSGVLSYRNSLGYNVMMRFPTVDILTIPFLRDAGLGFLAYAVLVVSRVTTENGEKRALRLWNPAATLVFFATLLAALFVLQFQYFKDFTFFERDDKEKMHDHTWMNRSMTIASCIAACVLTRGALPDMLALEKEVPSNAVDAQRRAIM